MTDAVFNKIIGIFALLMIIPAIIFTVGAFYRAVKEVLNK